MGPYIRNAASALLQTNHESEKNDTIILFRYDALLHVFDVIIFLFVRFHINRFNHHFFCSYDNFHLQVAWREIQKLKSQSSEFFSKSKEWIRWLGELGDLSDFSVCLKTKHISHNDKVTDLRELKSLMCLVNSVL